MIKWTWSNTILHIPKQLYLGLLIKLLLETYLSVLGELLLNWEGVNIFLIFLDGFLYRWKCILGIDLNLCHLKARFCHPSLDLWGRHHLQRFISDLFLKAISLITLYDSERLFWILWNWINTLNTFSPRFSLSSCILL